jgi:hypothetical protein
VISFDQPPREPITGQTLGWAPLQTPAHSSPSPLWTGIASRASVTDEHVDDIALLEVSHRQHAQVEDPITTVKAPGGSYLPFHSFAPNAGWFELALAAHDVIAWTQLLTLDGEHPDQRAEATALPNPARRRPVELGCLDLVTREPTRSRSGDAGILRAGGTL